jgi:hypothetical protein
MCLNKYYVGTRIHTFYLHKAHIYMHKHRIDTFHSHAYTQHTHARTFAQRPAECGLREMGLHVLRLLTRLSG